MQNSQNPWPIQVNSVILHASGICPELLIKKDLRFCLLSHPPSRDAANKLGNRQDAAVKVWRATQTSGSQPLELRPGWLWAGKGNNWITAKNCENHH